MTQLQKATEWLNKRCNYYPVAVKRRGFAEYIAYVFRLKRDNKPDVWFCVDMVAAWEIKSIRRICT